MAERARLSRARRRRQRDRGRSAASARPVGGGDTHARLNDCRPREGGEPYSRERWVGHDGSPVARGRRDKSALQRLQRGRGAGTQEAHVAADGEEAKALRALLAEYGQGGAPGDRGPVRGLARLLRRNPTDAERLLWDAFTNDRRFAGKGIKRQVPVGTHITDFVSFPLRLVIDVVPAHESTAAAKARAERRAWLSE
ncbi:MAG: DUF559 domain-containing protein, partial [Hyphomicrobiales bacterium]|nr:DUF559 domain-containing protein [Hyphomicrobiales bacterium]